MLFERGIPEKANRILNLILLGFLLILARVWYLSIVQHDAYLEKAQKPQRRTVLEQGHRGTIRDRFNTPLAVNKTQLCAAVMYADLRQIPTHQWVKDEQGEKIRIQARVQYIQSLAQLLGKELELDPEGIEDLIHAKAALFPHIPYILKTDLSEKEYYRLRMLEKDWIGLQAVRSSQRIYPQGKIGAEVVGYLGAISQNEYLHIAQEMNELQEYLSLRETGEILPLPKGFENPIEVRYRLKQLQEKAYTINDLVGKTGIEGYYDEQLRGSCGRKIVEVDRKGNVLRELPGTRKPESGNRLLLTLSAELQEYAESLLAQLESHKSSSHLDEPWIKGGAIVAMEPKTGEVLALGSYPRFDPNDFIPGQAEDCKIAKRSAVAKWLENERYLGEIWDGIRPLEKEVFSSATLSFRNEGLYLSWEEYLEALFPPESPVRNALQRVGNIENAIKLQNWMEELLSLSNQKSMAALIQALYPGKEYTKSTKAFLESETRETLAHLEQNIRYHPLKDQIDPFLSIIHHHDDQMLLLDICRTIVPNHHLSSELLLHIGTQSLGSFRALCQTASSFKERVEARARHLFHTHIFSEWREREFKDWLKNIRAREKKKKKYPRPYTDYLEKKEKELFKEFWETNHLHFLITYLLGEIPSHSEAIPLINDFLVWSKMNRPQHMHLDTLQGILRTLAPDKAVSYLKALRSFRELNRPLWGHYRYLRNRKGEQTEKDIASAFYPSSGFGYVRSQAYRQATPLGSVFKLVVAYEGLKERYEKIRLTGGSLNPLTLIDETRVDPQTKSLILGYHLNGEPICRNYKGGRMPKSSHPHMGRVDILGALEQSSNVYFSVLASEHIDDPMSICHAAAQFGFGEKTGIDLTGEYAGYVPEDVVHDKTGLYAFAIGQHSLIVTPLQTATMFSAIANNGNKLRPKLVQCIAGKETAPLDEDLFFKKPLYKIPLSLVGLPFNLFTVGSDAKPRHYVDFMPTEIMKTVFFPPEVRQMILEGMQQVIMGPRGTGRPAVVKRFPWNPQGVRDYVDLHEELVAKTGTAEILYKHSIDAATPALMDKHVWFAAIAFPSLRDPNALQPWENSDLVVIVYVRFGQAGRDGAAIAAQMIKKWREICQRHGKSSYLE